MYRLSVVIPVHNAGQYLRQSVLSVRNQTLKDIEIILVENGSTDNSWELCKEISAEDVRIRAVRLEVGDVSSARNEGVRQASTEYVGFVDSDDIISEKMYETLYSLASENDLDVVSCNYLRRYPKGQDKFQYCEDGSVIITSSKEMLMLNMMDKVPQSTCTMLVRKSILEQVPFPVGKHFEDRINTFKFISRSERCGHIYKSYYYYFQYRGHICRAKTFKRNHDCAESDIDRLRFIMASPMFSYEEKKLIAAQSSESLLRKINRMGTYVSTPEKRQEYNEIKRMIYLIPEGTKLSVKARLIRFLLRNNIMPDFKI